MKATLMRMTPLQSLTSGILKHNHASFCCRMGGKPQALKVHQLCDEVNLQDINLTEGFETPQTQDFI